MKFILTNKRFHFLVLSLIAGALLFLSGSDNQFRLRFQFLTFDTFNRLHQRPSTDLVSIVDIDEASLHVVGQWPWPRPVVGQLINRLNELGAEVIGFDMVFAEKDRTSPSFVATQLDSNVINSEVMETIKALPDHDDIFTQVIKDAGNVVTGFTGARLDETLRIPPKKVALLLPRGSELPFYLNSYATSGVLTNLPEFSKASKGNGSFIATPEMDGIIRRVSLFVTFPDPALRDVYAEKAPQLAKVQTGLYPMLALDVVRAYAGGFYKIKPVDDKNLLTLPYALKLGKKYTIPLDTNTRFWMHYRTIDPVKEYLSAYKVLDPAFEDEIKPQIEGKIIMVGTSAQGLRDIRSTPLGVFIPGVEVHVNAIEQILQNHYLVRTFSMIDLEGVFIAVIAFMIIFFTTRLGVPFMGVFVTLIVGLSFAGAYYAYRQWGLLFDPTFASFSILAMFFLTVILNFIRIEADRRQVREAFGLYISPSFMAEIAKNPDKLKLGGEVKELTVLFSDIRSFTTISESLPPEELIQLMNDFLTPMSDLVMENRGTIDKYMGDAMMAFWNAPLDDEDHVRHACFAAVQMQNSLAPLNEVIVEKAKEEGREPILLRAGIGLNTGPCSVGNMGSRQRFAYSALGDAVNLASRLEGQTKEYGVNILIGENTANGVPDFATLELDFIQVKGKKKPERIFTLLGDDHLANKKSFKTLKKNHAAMLKAYRAQEFDKAKELIAECITHLQRQIKKRPELDVIAYYDMMEKRISGLARQKLPKDWDGVFVATTK